MRQVRMTTDKGFLARLGEYVVADRLSAVDVERIRQECPYVTLSPDWMEADAVQADRVYLMGLIMPHLLSLFGEGPERPEVVAKRASSVVSAVYELMRHRRYHGVGHLRVVLEAAEEFARPVEERVALLLHDAIYSVGAPSGRNEDLSADLAQLLLWPVRCSRDSLVKVQRLVRSTAGYDTTGAISESHWICDLDLIGFSIPWWGYRLTNRLIHEEYVQRKDYDKEVWVMGRIRFLRAMLSKGDLFYYVLSDQRKEAALQNIRWEIELLEQGKLAHQCPGFEQPEV